MALPREPDAASAEGYPERGASFPREVAVVSVHRCSDHDSP